MSKAAKTRRVEPRFDRPARSGKGRGLSVTSSDRVLPAQKTARRKPRSSGAKTRRPRRKGRGLFRSLFYWSFIAAIWLGVIGVGIVAYFGAQLPSADTWGIPDRPPNVKIIALDGSQLANRGATGGEALTLREMPPHLPQAVIAIEDRRFYSHPGVDVIGLGRALIVNVTRGDYSQGGSTITQQLVKNLYLKPERTIRRKVQEVLLAAWLESKHSKDEILEMYLNRVYFGSGAYGVEAASRRYFNKSARQVTLAEAALLAGLLKAPSRLSPARDPQAAEARAQVVLTAMREQNLINDGDLTRAISAPAVRAAAFWTGSEHYVADRIMEELPGLIGPIEEDVDVYTSIDRGMQVAAEQAIRSAIAEKGKALNVSQGALVAIDRDGGVRALVGGLDYAHSQFDRASEARRQPGSAFKPFVFMAAMEQGRTPQSVRNDAPFSVGNWKPENYQSKYLGQITLAEAMARSSNSIAAQLAMEVGPKTVVDVAKRMGVESRLRADASIALGTSEVTPLELTAAFVPFANGGLRPDIHFIDRVTTRSGKVLYQRTKGPAPRVASAEVIGMMNYMMAGTLGYGTGRNAAFGWPAAGKTGTTQGARDAWFVGYTAQLVAGVWFGNDTAKPTKATGGTLPALAWRDFMTAAHKGMKPRALPGGWAPGDASPVAAGPVAAGAVDSDPDDDVARMITSSVNEGRSGHPVPPANVGERSIIDIILGN